MSVSQSSAEPAAADVDTKLLPSAAVSAVVPRVPAPALITSCFPEELAAHLAGLGQPEYRARQVLHGVYRRRARDFAAMSDLPAALRIQLAAEFVFPA